MDLDAIRERYLEKMAESFEDHEYPLSIKNSFEYAAKRWGNIHPSMTSYLLGSIERIKGIKKGKMNFIIGILPILESIINALDDIIDEEMKRPERFKLTVIVTFGFLSLFDNLSQFQKKRISDFAKPLLGHKMLTEDLLNKVFSELIMLSQIPEAERESEIKILKAKSKKKELDHAIEVQDMRSSGVNVYLHFIYSILGIKENKNFSNIIRSLRFLELIKDDMDDLSHDMVLNDPSPVSAFYRKYKKSLDVFENRINMLVDFVMERVNRDLEELKGKKFKEASNFLKKRIDGNRSKIRKTLHEIEQDA